MVKHSFFVLGDPAALAYHTFHNGRMFETHKNLKERWRDQVIDQHEPSPKLVKPIDLTINFFFLKSPTHAPYPKRGEIAPLIKFVSDIISSTILKTPALIVSVTGKKLFIDTNPRTEFFITENYG